MRIIGLTGGIACGKSTVSGWLGEQLDCRIIDGDQLARQLTGPGGSALPLLREAFGSSVFLSNGTLNRQRLGSLIFSNDSARRKLDDLMAPLLKALTLEELQAARSAGVSLCFLDYPLLFEKGYDELCDSVWCVYLPRPLQMQRLMDRDRITEQEALRRMNAVLSSEEKADRSDIIIDNSGTVSYTLSLLPPLLEAERQKAMTTGEKRRRRSDRYLSREKADESEAEFSMAAWQRDSLSQVSDSLQTPDSIERPAAIRRKASERKVQWVLPAWLLAAIIACSFLLACGTTAQILMHAYLSRQSDRHQAEAQAVLHEYPLEYRDLIESMAAEFNLAPAFVASIVRNESSFQPWAESAVGARGLMQLMPETAEWIARKIKMQSYAFDRMYDPESNVQFGCWYLNYLAALFHGDPVCVACAYHAGQGQVTAWLSDPLISSDGAALDLNSMSDGPTKTYARRVIKAYGIYQTLYFDGADPYDILLPRQSQ